MRTKDQGTLDKILKFVNKYYQENRVAPTISEVAAGVGVARSTTHRYIQELSDRDLLDYGRGIHQVENTHIKDLLQGTEAQIAKVISDDPIIFFEPLCRAGVDVYFLVHVNHSYRVL